MRDDKYGFVYIWYDCKRKMYYIGSHWGTEDDGYVCSSRRMRNAYQYRPQDFKRRVLIRVYTDRTELLSLEENWLSLINFDDLGKKYYNLSKQANRNGSDNRKTNEKISQSLTGRKLSEEHKKKISESLKGHTGYWKGKSKPQLEETKKKIGKANAVSLKGKKFSEERKRRLKELRPQKGKDHPLYGKHHTDETKKKISETLKKRSV